jgi:hypothetical protein
MGSQEGLYFVKGIGIGCYRPIAVTAGWIAYQLIGDGFFREPADQQV